MARFLIAGCGDVGTRLGLALAGQGHRVFGLRRTPSALPAPITPLAADLTDPTTLELPEGLDGVFYTTAADGFAEPAYRAAYHTGVVNLLAALERGGQGPRRGIMISSTSVYGQRAGEWIDDTSPANATGFSGHWLRAGEAHWRGGLPEGIVLRLGGIYGPGRTRLIDQVRRGGRYREGVYTNRIHRDDATAALLHLWHLQTPAPLYLGVDTCPALEQEVMEWLAERLGAPPPIPATADDQGQRRRPSANKRCWSRRLQESGFVFRYPSYRQGYGALLEELSPSDGPT